MRAAGHVVCQKARQEDIVSMFSLHLCSEQASRCQFSGLARLMERVGTVSFGTLPATGCGYQVNEVLIAGRSA
ncbi:MAG: hypothetical protein AVDCRST_MAG93-5889 [uncultured Chloroflexia bacterium]|uniref:Uncharacterized protein n=1 Tax=uncultured Chloroflexia bacterium TaxID=1672391 RepID=A0A6J4L735_9CHLR|nr:MAG: hypothetical protein AVDCRST_MAG93-5889 [uncultured Chloroflexia bacterium]